MEIIVKQHNDPRLAGALKHNIDKYGGALVKVGKPKHKRSDKQRRLQWFWHGMISDETGNDENEVHNDLKVNVLYMRCIKPGLVDSTEEYMKECMEHESNLRELRGTKFYEGYKMLFARDLSTADLKTDEFSIYLESVRKWISDQLDLYLPTEEDLINKGVW